MTISAEFIKRLVEHPESETLDVKSEQYLFLSQDKDKKSELLKDVLAFANAFVSDDSYILVGVRQQDPPPHKIVGITTTLDDAKLQQFIDGKTERKPTFSYEEIAVDGSTVGVYRIPPQNGPFVAKKDFGKVKHALLPVRRGTTTDHISLREYFELVQEHARAPFVGPDSRRANAAVDRAMQNQLIRLNAIATDSVDRTFDRCGELLRVGDSSGAMEEIVRVIADSSLMGELSEPQRARAFRIKANLLLRAGDVDGAEEQLALADSISLEEEPKIHAMVALHRSGVDEALRVLGEPTTDDGRQLAAQLLISAGKPTEALEVLPDEVPLPVNSLRPRALAQIVLGRRKEALTTANEALEREPAWLDSLITAGMAHYFCALSPALNPAQIFSPDPVPEPLFVGDPQAFGHLQNAERHFRAAMEKKLAPHEIENTELWLLAVLALQRSRREDANAVLNSLLAKEPTHTLAVLWAVSYQLEFDREATRQRCLDNLSGATPSVSDVVTYLVLDGQPNDESIEFLDQHHSLFESEEQVRLYDHWHTRLIEETRDANSDDKIQTIHGVIERARQSGSWMDVEQLISNSPDDLIVLTIAAEALADANQWPIVVKFASRLVDEVSTEFAYRLSATALLNTGRDRDCLAVIQEWGERHSGEQTPSVEFWRLQSAALARLGDVAGALQSVATLLSHTRAPRDLSHAADIYLRVGDVRAAALHIVDLVNQDAISAAEAINWSRAVQNDDQVLAEKLLDHAAAKGIAPQLAGAAYDMAIRLNRDDLRDRFFGDLAAAAQMPGTGVQTATFDDALSWMRDRRERIANVNDLYLTGQIPLTMACDAANDNVALRFEAAFRAYRSEKWTDALLVEHGSRVDVLEGLPDIAEWIISLDLSSLIILEGLDLLPKLQRSAKTIRFPFELPGALLEIGDQLAAGQPSRLACLRTILRALESGDFLSDRDNLPDLNSDKAVRVVFDANRADDSMPLVGLKQLFEAAIERGVIDDDEAQPAIASHAVADDVRLDSPIPTHPTLFFDGNTIEVVMDVFGLERLRSFATCVIESNYADVVRADCDFAELRQQALTRVTRLRRIVSEGIRAGDYQLLPQLGSDVRAEHESRTSLEGMLLSLLSQPAEPGCVIAFDDRLVNRHRSTDHHPIVCTSDIIEYLRRAEALSKEQNHESRARLRDSNIFFALPDAEDIAYALSLAEKKDGVIVETPRLKSLRRYVARVQSLQEHLDLQPSAGAPNEVPLVAAMFRIATSAIDAVFADETLELEEAQSRAAWIWQYIHVTTDECLPLNNRTPASVRLLLAVQLSGLLSSCMTTFMVSVREARDEWMKSQIEWIWANCIAPYLEGNRGLLPTIAEHLRQCIGPLPEQAQKDAPEADKNDVFRASRAYVARLVMALPPELKDHVLSDAGFATRFGMQVQSVAEVGGVMTEQTVFHQGLVESVVTKSAQSFETKNGEATVELVQRGTLRRPTVVEFSGAISLRYADPFLHLHGEHRNRQLAEFLEQTDWIDLPPSALASFAKKSELLTDTELYALLDQLRRRNAPHHYKQLADAMAAREPLAKPDFDAPPVDDLLQMLRLPRQSRKRFSFLLDAAVNSLVDQYGAIVAFERLCGLPVDLASRFVGPLSTLVEQHPRKIKRWLLSPCGTVLRRAHKLSIAAALSSRGLLSVATVRSALRALLADWQPNSELFIQVLKTTDQLLSDEVSVVGLPAGKRLAAVWTHAEHVASIVNDDLRPGDDGAGFFRKISHRSLAASLNIDLPYETDVAVPDVMYRPILLYFSMSYIHSQSRSIMSKPLLQDIDKLLRFSDETSSPLSPRLLQGRSTAPNSLDSFLDVVSQDFRTRFNSVNDERAYADNWFYGREFELTKGPMKAPIDSVLWSEVLAHEQRWLKPVTRLALLDSILTIDWVKFNEESEQSAICALMLAADLISYVEDEPTATKFANDLLLASMSAVPLSESDLDGSESPFNFQRAMTEVAYRAARSIDMGRSCRILASTLRIMADRQATLRKRIIGLLDAAIPMLPVEHVLPLVILRRSLRGIC